MPSTNHSLSTSADFNTGLCTKKNLRRHNRYATIQMYRFVPPENHRYTFICFLFSKIELFVGLWIVFSPEEVENVSKDLTTGKERQKSRAHVETRKITIHRLGKRRGRNGRMRRSNVLSQIKKKKLILHNLL